MTGEIAINGYGPVGRAIARLLEVQGRPMRIVQRSRPSALPKTAQYVHADARDSDALKTALRGAGTMVCAVGIPYTNTVYSREWPKVMRACLSAAAAAKSRFVFADNLYMYGPQTAPHTEDMPLTDYGIKPRVRADISKMWMDAYRAGQVEAVAVRASDFYGPDVSTSVIAAYAVSRMVRGQAAQIPYSPDFPHDFTYVPDFARAVLTLADASGDAYGQAWHVPNAPTQTLRQIVERASALMQKEPRIQVLPAWLRSILSIFRPDVHALQEMQFQWDRPYLVDTSKFGKRFWSDATSFDEGLTATIEWYRART